METEAADLQFQKITVVLSVERIDFCKVLTKIVFGNLSGKLISLSSLESKRR